MDHPGKILYVGLDLSHFLESNVFGMTKAEFLSMVSNWFFSPDNPGDLNSDGILDILDIVITVDIIMGNIIPSEEQEISADMTQDGIIDILDITIMVAQIIDGGNQGDSR